MRAMYNGKESKIRPRTGHEGLESEYKYSCTFSLASALTPHFGRFTSGKETRYQFYRRLGGPQGWSGRVPKISPTLGFDPHTVQPVASRYTD